MASPIRDRPLLEALNTYASGIAVTDAEIGHLRSRATPNQWLEACRKREANIGGAAPSSAPYPEASLVRLRAGGPMMTVETLRPHEKLVQCVWLDVLGRAQRDAFHKDALMPARAVPPGGVAAAIRADQAAVAHEIELTDAVLDMVACEIYRVQSNWVGDANERSPWQALGGKSRDMWRAIARAAWTAILELQD